MLCTRFASSGVRVGETICRCLIRCPFFTKGCSGAMLCITIKSILPSSCSFILHQSTESLLRVILCRWFTLYRLGAATCRGLP
ncbi:hypothetical protein GDO81_020326 [Engystomops pustulosus]|uniref:Secreted protein n=1 Tax=Engystomops pustulosus TaxID=76066 RepID=A0AAV6ZQP1_ENGPU|nr:hypothetical protein GDO81_020326 [Engystomops pustulosus]